MNKHGIAIRERKTKKLIDFVECSTGRSALRVLGGVRINMSPEYKAEEEFISEEDITSVKI